MNKEAAERGRQEALKLLEERKQRKQKPLKIGQWFLFRFDELNWVVTKNIEDTEIYRYFPNISWALQDILHQNIGDANASTVKELLEAIHRLEAVAEKAVSSWENRE